MHAVIDERAYNAKTGPSCRRSAASISTRRSCCWPRSISCPPDDPRFVATVDAVGQKLRRGDLLHAL